MKAGSRIADWKFTSKMRETNSTAKISLYIVVTTVFTLCYVIQEFHMTSIYFVQLHFVQSIIIVVDGSVLFNQLLSEGGM